MSGGHRKVSRSTVDNSFSVNSVSGCHFKQPENELKQKLDALDTSFKISNRKISSETKELKQILFDLQRDLKESKSSNYVPSLFEEQRSQVKRQRRITVASTSHDPTHIQTLPRSPVGGLGKRQRKTSSTTYQPDVNAAATLPRSRVGDLTKRQRKVSKTTYQPEAKVNKVDNLITENANDVNIVSDDEVISKAGEADNGQRSSDQQPQEIEEEYKESNKESGDGEKDVLYTDPVHSHPNPLLSTASVDNESNEQRKEAITPNNKYLEQRHSNPLHISITSINTYRNDGTGTEISPRQEKEIYQPVHGTYSYSLATDSKADHISSPNKPSTCGLTYSKHFNEDRKRSLSDSDASYRDAFRGRFVTHSLSEKFKDRCSIDVTVHNQQKRTRRVTVASSTPPVGLRRPIDVADFTIADSRRKRNTSGRGHIGFLSSQRDELDDVFDGNEGKNSLIVGRTQDARQKRYSSVYKPSAHLPPLREETNKHNQAVKQWENLDQCRYLRKEDQILSIEDIFRKD